MPLDFAEELTLNEIAAYHRDVLSSLRSYFSESSPEYVSRFLGESQETVHAKLALRLSETDTRSALATLTSIEASFRIDFNYRCRARLKDDLSRYFRQIEQVRATQIRLDDDILEGWKRHTNIQANVISDLRSAFRFRHWLAHGRYWQPKLGKKYDFTNVFLLAERVSGELPLLG